MTPRSYRQRGRQEDDCSPLRYPPPPHSLVHHELLPVVNTHAGRDRRVLNAGARCLGSYCRGAANAVLRPPGASVPRCWSDGGSATRLSALSLPLPRRRRLRRHRRCRRRYRRRPCNHAIPLLLPHQPPLPTSPSPLPPPPVCCWCNTRACPSPISHDHSISAAHFDAAEIKLVRRLYGQRSVQSGRRER